MADLVDDEREDPRKPRATRDYEVGYGKTPRHSRWRPGESGNPNRGPRRKLALEDEVRKVLAMPVKAKQGGRTKSIPTLGAALLQLRQRALEGDLKALSQLLGLAREYTLASLPQGFKDLLEEDERLIAQFLAGRKSTGGDEPD